VEMEAQAVRKDMRELVKEVEDLASKFEMLHASAGGRDERLADQASRLLANARNLGQSLTTLTGNAQQAHFALRSSRFGVLGWNIHHDAQTAEEIASRVIKVCQRLFGVTQVDCARRCADPGSLPLRWRCGPRPERFAPTSGGRRASNASKTPEKSSFPLMPCNGWRREA